MISGLLICIVLAFLAAPVIPLLHRPDSGRTGWLAALIPGGIGVYLLSRIPAMLADGAVVETVPWVPGLAVNLAMRLDGLAMLFALLVCLVGALVFCYCSGYMKGHEQSGRFLSFMMAFFASMLGLVLADNLLTLYIFFELTSLFSFFLIGFNGAAAESRRAARQALLLTNVGGLALLAGLLLMAKITGTFTISELLTHPEAIQSSPYYVAALLLFFGGALTKSAQYPFSFWLPNAMEAPTPVSTYLHSAAMVKAGIYLLARFYPVLGGTSWWFWILVISGGITMVAGGWLSLAQRDLKKVLAYTTIMALGLIVFLIGIGGKTGLEAALVYVVVHACYKAALFMIAGAIDHETGTRDLTILRGLRGKLPKTFIATILACLSMAGLPPLFGFIGKELAYKAATHAPTWPWILAAAALLANIAVVGISGVVTLRPFLGELSDKLPKKPHAAPISLWLGPVVLSVLGLALGLFPAPLEKAVMIPAVSAALGQEASFHLVLWHGLNLELALSVVTVAGGIGVYMLWPRLLDSSLLKGLDLIAGTGLDRLFERIIDGVAWVAEWQTKLIQRGRLNYYVSMIIVTAVALVGMALWQSELTWRWPAFGATPGWHEWAVIATIVFGAIAVLFVHSRLTNVLVLSAVSYSVALFFLLYGAPDLALTQLLVETLMAILVVLAFCGLPRIQPLSNNRTRLRHGLIGAAAGTMITVLMLISLSMPFDTRISDYFINNAYKEAHGGNIVNVILVDFRALDTLGEITVVCVAGLSVLALLRLRRQSPDATTEEPTE